MTQGFIFDLDGTLADTMPAHYAAWTLVVQRHGLTFPEPRFYTLGGMPTVDIARLLINEAGIALAPEQLANEKLAAFLGSLAEPGVIRPVEPVVAIAREKRHCGRLAVASGGLRSLVKRTLELLQIADWFHAIVGAEDTVRHKPEPDVFLEAARRIGVPPKDCTVYEDTDLGLEAAQRAGMQGFDIRTLLSVNRSAAHPIG